MNPESLTPTSEKVELVQRLNRLYATIRISKDMARLNELEAKKQTVVTSLQAQFPKVDGHNPLAGIPEWETLIGGGERKKGFDETIRAVVIQEFEEFLDAIEAKWKIQ